MCRPVAKLPSVLRQPPPPIRPHAGGSPMHGTLSEKENNIEMADGSKFSFVDGKTRPSFFKRCFFKRCKRKVLKTTNIESLPDDIILEILVRVPAQDIYNATRLVCRKWYKIVHSHNFIHAHLQQRSTRGLLAQRNRLTFVAAGRKSLVETSKLNYVFRRTVLSSCNGLVLESHNDNHVNLYITNPVTSQHFALPEFLIKVICYGHALVYAATSMEYKVARTFDAGKDDCIAILTVGVDKDWTRRVNTQHVSRAAKKLLLSKQALALTTEGFVHWAQNDIKECVLTLNVETEIISEFPVPTCIRHDGEAELMYYYLPMESYLSLLIERSEFSWEVWEMKPATGEWTKRPNIDLKAQFDSSLMLNSKLIPVGWLKCRELLVLGVSWGKSLYDCSISTRYGIAFNVHTCEFVKFKMYGGLKSFLVHRNSLVWMDGC